MIGRPFTEFIDLRRSRRRASALAEIAANARPAVHGSAAHPPQGRAADPVRGQRRRPGRRRRPAGRDPRRRPRRQRARAPRAASCASSEERYRFLVENSPDIVFYARTRRPASCSSRTRSSGSPVSARTRSSGETSTGHRPDLDARRRRALGAASWPTRPSRRCSGIELHAQGRRHRPPFEITVAQLDSEGNFAGVHGSARDIARARAPRARAARVRGALPLPRPVVARPRLDDRRRRPVHVRLRPGAADPRLGAGGADRPLVRRARPAGERRGALARFRWPPATAAPRPTGRGSSSATRDGRELAMEITGIGMVAGRRVPRRARRGPRRQRARAAGARPPAPGRRARLVRGALAPRPGAPRLGHPGPVLDDAAVAVDRAAARSRTRPQVPGKLASLRELQREALAEMRALIFELRPGNVEEHGLIQALRTHCAVAVRAGSGCRWWSKATSPSGRRSRSRRRSTGSPRRRSTTSSSTRARSRSGSRSGACPTASASAVIDDGRGFDPAAVPDGHLGLAGHAVARRAARRHAHGRLGPRQGHDDRGRRARRSTRRGRDGLEPGR